MSSSGLTLRPVPGRFAVCRLPPGSPVPEWALSGDFSCLVRTPRELSVVCDEAGVPPGFRREDGWACLGVQEPLDFSLTGVLASLTGALARAGVSVFAISTFDTDYLLVPEGSLPVAHRALEAAGHRILEEARWEEGAGSGRPAG